MDTSTCDYRLPDELVAQQAIEPRDSSRLLLVPGLLDATFRDLPSLLRPNDLLVVNRTRVRAARLTALKQDGGGRLELLLTKRLDRDRWEVLVRPARRVRAGTKFEAGPIPGRFLTAPQRGVAIVTLDGGERDVDDLIAEVGTVPLPPYFHGEVAADRYQTVFAKTMGSAAAPTAGLHFTPALLSTLQDAGVRRADIDLEVGLDTFRPMADGSVADHLIHRERYRVPQAAAAAIARARVDAGRVVAVGTTVVRALETAAATGTVQPCAGETDLFIVPGHRFRAVDVIITNFHAPRTTLLALVAAFQPAWREAYEAAIARGYRFLSFGDAMMIEGPGS